MTTPVGSNPSDIYEMFKGSLTQELEMIDSELSHMEMHLQEGNIEVEPVINELDVAKEVVSKTLAKMEDENLKSWFVNMVQDNYSKYVTEEEFDVLNKAISIQAKVNDIISEAVDALDEYLYMDEVDSKTLN